MKKLLSIIGTITIAGSGISAVVACNNDSESGKSVPATGGLKPAITADDIAKLVTTKTITVPIGTNTDVSKDKTAIDKALLAANQKLEGYMNLFTYSGGALRPSEAVDVTATITAGTGKAIVPLKVTLLSNDQTKANEIKDAINTGYIYTLPYNNGNARNASDEKSSLDAALIKVNTNLANDDLQYIKYSGTIKADPAVFSTVTIVITVNDAVATTDLTKVHLYDSDENRVNAIKNKIQETDDLVIKGTSTSASDNASAIKTALYLRNVGSLGIADLVYMTFSGNLKEGEPESITLTITVGSANTRLSISVELNEQSAEDIKNMIDGKTFHIDYSVTNVQNTGQSSVITGIREGIIRVFPSIGTYTVQAITFNVVDLTVGQPANVVATINIGTLVTADITVIYDYNPAQQIINKISVTDITVPGTTVSPNTQDPVTEQAIKKAINSANSNRLTDAELNSISIAPAELRREVAVPVTITAKVTDSKGNTYSQIKTLNLTLNADNNSILNKIPTDITLSVPNDTPLSIEDASPALKADLAEQVPALSAQDMDYISFSPSTQYVKLVYGEVVSIYVIVDTNQGQAPAAQSINAVVVESPTQITNKLVEIQGIQGSIDLSADINTSDGDRTK